MQTTLRHVHRPALYAEISSFHIYLHHTNHTYSTYLRAQYPLVDTILHTILLTKTPAKATRQTNLSGTKLSIKNTAPRRGTIPTSQPSQPRFGPTVCAASCPAPSNTCGTCPRTCSTGPRAELKKSHKQCQGDLYFKENCTSHVVG